MFHFPKNVYADVRINEGVGCGIGIVNGEVRNDSEETYACAQLQAYTGFLP